jgi:hypothetical protein
MDANSHEAGGIFDCACNSRPDPLEARAGPTPDHLVFVLTFGLTLCSGLSGEAVHTTCRYNLRCAKATPPYP